MGTNRHAIIRYKALDECFGNRYKEFAISDLVQACNDKLYSATGDSKYLVDIRRDSDAHNGIKKRQVYLDIKHMESEAGWSIELEKFRNDRNEQCYRYKDPDFSITQMPLTSEEFDHLKETILMLGRFQGMPHFEWMEDLLVHLEDKFGLRGTTKPVMGFDQNVDFTGLKYINPLFGYITQKQPILVNYHTARGVKHLWTIHPYYLKEFNNRWFLFGWGEDLGLITNLALDRIDSIEAANSEFRENTDIDFEEFFDDVVGVTIPDSPVESVRLKFSPSRFLYIKSKPIHMTQRYPDPGNGVVEIRVKVNRELETLILSYGNDVEVLCPQSLRDSIASRLESASKLYNN